jgi:hypothetical protein
MRRKAPWTVLLLALAGAALAGPSTSASGSGAPPAGMPPAGHVRLGVGIAKPVDFDRLTHHHHDVWETFNMLGGVWVKYGRFGKEIDQATASHRIALMTLGATRVSDRRKLSPGALAHGTADAIYLSYSEQANSRNVPVWIRPMQEMDGYWMSYCAFNANGTRKGANYTTTQYRNAFRRIAIIMRGGTKAQINTELGAAHLRPLQAPLAASGITPSGQVEMLWNPQGRGAPNVRGNQPKNYWPGAAYVDFVGDDLYSQSFHAYWPGMKALYGYGKPFILGEWAPWGNDDPTFVNEVFTWARNHPRTAAIVYFAYGTPFSLGNKPRSLAAYRNQAARAAFNTSV